MTELKSLTEGDDRPDAAIQQPHKLGLVFLESEAAARPGGGSWRRRRLNLSERGDAIGRKVITKLEA